MSYFQAIEASSSEGAARFFLELTLREISASATEAQQRAFLQALGRNLAACFPLDPNGDLGALEGAVNAVWRRLALGDATIGFSDDAILIHHRLGDARSHADADADCWHAALPAILEGAYDGWLRALGSSARLHTQQIAATPDRIEFRHGL